MHVCSSVCVCMHMVHVCIFIYTASSSDGLAEVLSFIRIRDQPHVSRTHRVANLNLLAKVSGL